MKSQFLAFTKCDKVYGLLKKIEQLNIFICSTLWPYQPYFLYSFPFTNKYHSLWILWQLFSTIELTFHFINISKLTIKAQWNFVTVNHHETNTKYLKIITLLITITIRVIYGIRSADSRSHSKPFVTCSLKILDFSAHLEKKNPWTSREESSDY